MLPGATTLTGDSSLRKRPMGPLLDALRALGAGAISLGGDGRPPVEIRGTLRGGSASLPGDVSSQFLSSLLLAGPLAAQGVEIRVIPPIRSEPYIKLTVQMMRWIGAYSGCQLVGKMPLTQAANPFSRPMNPVASSLTNG